MREQLKGIRSLHEKRRTKAAFVRDFMNSVIVEGGGTLPQTQPGTLSSHASAN